jgi:hypothetical protein
MVLAHYGFIFIPLKAGTEVSTCVPASLAGCAEPVAVVSQGLSLHHSG